MGRNHDEEVDNEIKLNRPQPETLRMKVRDAITDCLGNTESAQVTGEIMELAPDIADAIFDALGISEFEQDEYSEVRPTGEGRTT